MASERDYDQRLGQFAALLQTISDRLGSSLIADPTLQDELVGQIESQLQAWEATDASAPPPPDGGLGQLAGVGPDSAQDMGDTRMVQGVTPYDDQVAAERIIAVGDLYYIFQHEKIGVFRVVKKLQDLFRAGAVRLSDGDGAFRLYQFDRREVLRYTKRERQMAYRRAFGYGRGPVARDSRPNGDFHPLFAQFVNQVTLYWRDKRISDVIRERANDPAFGSIAVVRRAGLDLRNNLKFMSFGHLNVLRVEVMQILEEAFRILDAPDIKNLFGAADSWDVVEEVLVRYFNERLVTSPRQRMAVTGRNLLRWLAQPYILDSARGPFETMLLDVAEDAEEWLTSAQSLGLAVRTGNDGLLPWDRTGQPLPTRPVSTALTSRRNGTRPRRRPVGAR
jgi:hypothetical protein